MVRGVVEDFPGDADFDLDLVDDLPDLGDAGVLVASAPAEFCGTGGTLGTAGTGSVTGGTVGSVGTWGTGIGGSSTSTEGSDGRAGCVSEGLPEFCVR